MGLAAAGKQLLFNFSHTNNSEGRLFIVLQPTKSHMPKHKTILVLIFSCFIAIGLHAQRDTLSFYQQTQKVNNRGMMVLGSWAIANMTVGAFGMKNNAGEDKYFHQMNLLWNTVNASIASYALISGLTEDFSAYRQNELLAKHEGLEKILLINSGMDVLYIGAGAWMVKRSRSVTKRQALWKGYGRSVMLQGGFLLVFDLILYSIQHSRKMQFLENIDIQTRMNGISLKLKF